MHVMTIKFFASYKPINLWIVLIFSVLLSSCGNSIRSTVINNGGNTGDPSGGGDEGDGDGGGDEGGGGGGDEGDGGGGDEGDGGGEDEGDGGGDEGEGGGDDEGEGGGDDEGEGGGDDEGEGGGDVPLSASWTFDPNFYEHYFFDSTLIYLTDGGGAKLSSLDQIDDSATELGNGAGGGAALGVTYDTLSDGSDGLMLSSSGTPTNHSELNASWAPQWENLVSYWKMNNNWQDSKGSNHGTAEGTATFTTTSKIGSHAGSIDGEDNYVQLGIDGLFDNNTYTFSIWVKISVLPDPGNGNSIFNIGGGDADQFILINGNNGFVAGGYDIGGSTNAVGPSFPTTDRWYHLSSVRNTADETLTLYIDGVAVASSALSNPIAWYATNGPGAWLGHRGQWFNGTVDDLAIWSTALTADEIKHIYDRQSAKFSGTFESRVMDIGSSSNWTDFTWAPTLPFYKELPDHTSGSIQNELADDYPSLATDTLMNDIVALWHLNEASANTVNNTNDFKDSSGQDNHIDEFGGVTFGANGIFNQAAVFDGSDDYLIAPNAFENSTATWQAWIKPNTFVQNQGYNQHVLYQADALGSHETRIQVTTSGKVAWQVYSTDYECNFDSNASIQLGQWTHVVAMYGTRGCQLYLNGTLDTSTANTNGPGTGALRFAIGRLDVNETGYFHGAIDEVAIWNRALADEEVKQLYQRGASRVKFQVRSCNDSSCSGEEWMGPDGSNQTYFSELHNRAPGDASAETVFESFTASSNHNNFYFDENLSRINDGRQDTRTAWSGQPATTTLTMTFDDPVILRSTKIRFGMSGNDSWKPENAKLYRGTPETGVLLLTISSPSFGAPSLLSFSNDEASDLYTWTFDSEEGYLCVGEVEMYSHINDEPVPRTGATLATSPIMDFADFSALTIANNRYFQYRTILETDSDDIADGPEIKSIGVGPSRVSAVAPSIYTVEGITYNTLSEFAVTLGTAGCDGVPKYQLRIGSGNWKHWSAGSWQDANNSYDEANTESDVNTNITAFVNQFGAGDLNVRAFLNSDGSQECEIDSINITGTESEP